ncbi:S26 family signal peptidase [Phytomonospora endophytica]|uniref:Signal peptidase I n=1 Tax=Phytomonospora endophytica TaxID=714109 RepID=A0A841FAX0_9ACTN|nr:S26 family signal peptidase [Phytomonospora endophytica]MBB6032914.1 signal peptidase I [Phytomonospora endophytica]GIG65140.1 S26 family signal peptidase [Phytomonospora endophytica]
MIAVTVAVLAVVLLVLARSRLRLIEVDGVSMMPTLNDGQRILAWVGRSPRLGDVVVFAMVPRGLPGDPPWMIKRVLALPGDPVPAGLRAVVGGDVLVPEGSMLVLGDNPRSSDSRGFGYVSLTSVLGVAPGRRRRS